MASYRTWLCADISHQPSTLISKKRRFVGNIRWVRYLVANFSVTRNITQEGHNQKMKFLNTLIILGLTTMVYLASIICQPISTSMKHTISCSNENTVVKGWQVIPQPLQLVSKDQKTIQILSCMNNFAKILCKMGQLWDIFGLVRVQMTMNFKGLPKSFS